MVAIKIDGNRVLEIAKPEHILLRTVDPNKVYLGVQDVCLGHMRGKTLNLSKVNRFEILCKNKPVVKYQMCYNVLIQKKGQIGWVYV